MKKWLPILGSLAVIAALVGIGAFGVFSDTETAVDNQFVAGTVDLKIDGTDSPVTMAFSTTNMKPGSVYNGGCVQLHNAGTIDGAVTVQVNNLVSNENGLLEPEINAGDQDGVQIDTDGYNGNTGDGELWDQISIKMCYDHAYGVSNGKCDWNDTMVKNESSTNDDYSSLYSIKQNTDLGSPFSLGAGESVAFCVDVYFWDDTSPMWWGGSAGMTNNLAMSDDAMMDVIFQLKQAP